MVIDQRQLSLERVGATVEEDFVASGQRWCGRIDAADQEPRFDPGERREPLTAGGQKHPFAERISASALAACAAAQVPLLRLERPGFTERLDDHWHWVEDLEGAALQVPELGEGVLLTTGRQGLAAFATVKAWFLIRCVEEPGPPLPARHEVLLDRGPYTREGELALIDRHRIDVLVTKDSGGAYTAAKLDAARARELPVIVVRRPERPAAARVSTVEEALAWASADATQAAHPG